MSKDRGKEKRTPGANVDFVQIIPKFLQGRMHVTAKPKNLDDSDDEENRPTIVEEPSMDDRPDREDEAPTIVADDEIMALLAKQEVIVKDGKLERKQTQESSTKVPRDDSVVEFGAKRHKKTHSDSFPLAPNETLSPVQEVNPKKRSSETQIVPKNAKKRAEAKKMLSFDEEEEV